MSKSIRSVLEDLAYRHSEEGFTCPSPYDVGIIPKEIDQALKDIEQIIIDEAKPKSAYVEYDNNPQALHENRLYNSGIDQYQSNLREALGL